MAIPSTASLPVEAREALARLLPPDWHVDVDCQQAPPGDGGFDVLLTVREPHGLTKQIVVEAKRYLQPQDVRGLLGERLHLLRRLDPTTTVLVVAPWLSPRTRAVLEERDLNYLDFTGNAALTLDRPAVLIRTRGADRDPDPRRRAGISLRGAFAGRVVRFLVDVRPPYTATLLANRSGVSLPYVSRLLTKLTDDALIIRGSRGVLDVDWTNLLRLRAESYSLFVNNRAAGYLAMTGPADLLEQLRADDRTSRPRYRAVTGSFGASLHAPVTATAQLSLYVDDPNDFAAAAGLLPVEQGSDVVLLQAEDPVILDRTRNVDGLDIVSMSQLALDCLSGNGRMPAEGEALLEWMLHHEADWRLPNPQGLALRGAVT